MSNALKAIADFDVLDEFSRILTEPVQLDFDKIINHMENSFDDLYKDTKRDMVQNFEDRLDLLRTLITFIRDANGFKVPTLNYYDFINGMRLFRGDAYPYLINEIVSILNTINYLKTEIKLLADVISNEYKHEKNKTEQANLKAKYNDLKTLLGVFDKDILANNPPTEEQIRNLINSGPAVRGTAPHEGLNIEFDDTSSNRIVHSEEDPRILEKPGIYEIINDIKVGDLVEVRGYSQDGEYIIYYTNKKGVEVEIGHVPMYETNKNGISYVTKDDRSGDLIPRKFAYTDTDIDIFNQYQSFLFEFMYYYDICFGQRNNVSEEQKEIANDRLNDISQGFTNGNYKALIGAFKRLIYGNLSSYEIENLIDHAKFRGPIVENYDSDDNAKFNGREVPIAMNQMYQLCRDLFGNVIISSSNVGVRVSSDIIKRQLNKAMNYHEMIFEHTKAIRDDLYIMEHGSEYRDPIFRISNVGAGEVLINTKSHETERNSIGGLTSSHDRNSLLDSIRPVKDAIDANGNATENRVQIVYINENGNVIDTKTGKQLNDLSKFATPHVGNVITGRNRNALYVVIPQTDSLYTIFPVKNNTIAGSITRGSKEERKKRIEDYTNFILETIKDILALTGKNITDRRLKLSEKLQDLIICNENSDPFYNDIHFQSSNDEEGNRKSVMLKEVKGGLSSNNTIYHKFVQTVVNGRNVVLHYWSDNKKNVANYQGIIGDPHYTQVEIHYLDVEKDVERLDMSLKRVIPNMVRQFGLNKGKATSKKLIESSDASNTTKIIDPITGDKYDNIYDYYMETGAIYSDVDYVKDKNGKILSNVTLTGRSPIKFSIAPTNYDTEFEKPDRFWDPVVLLKSCADKTTANEDWEAISNLAKLLKLNEITPVYIKHLVAKEQLRKIGEGKTSALSLNEDSSYGGEYKIDIYYNPEYARANPGYLTRVLAHEMIHTYFLRFFVGNIFTRADPEHAAKLEALIDYNNKEWQEWFIDFQKAVINARKELENKTENLTDDEVFLKEMLSKGNVVDHFIAVVLREISNIDTRIKTKFKNRANGKKSLITGEDTISEIAKYVFTDPRVFRIVNLLKSTTKRAEGAENLKTPTFWQKFKDIIFGAFRKIFGFVDTDVRADSMLERFNDVINRIFDKEYMNFKPDGIIYGIKMDLVINALLLLVHHAPAQIRLR